MPNTLVGRGLLERPTKSCRSAHGGVLSGLLAASTPQLDNLSRNNSETTQNPPSAACNLTQTYRWRPIQLLFLFSAEPSHVSMAPSGATEKVNYESSTCERVWFLTSAKCFMKILCNPTDRFHTHTCAQWIWTELFLRVVGPAIDSGLHLGKPRSDDGS